MNLVLYSLFPAFMLLLFGGLISTWIHLVYRPDGQVEALTDRLGWITLAVFSLWMALITVQQGQVPVVTVGQLVAFLAFLVWAGQSYVQTQVRQRLLSVLPMAAVVVLILVGMVAGVQPDAAPDSIRGPWAAFHITLSLAGVAMLMGSGVFGAGQLMLSRRLEQRDFGQVFSQLPSLEEMNRLRRVALYGGWFLISVSLASAYIWALTRRDESGMVISHLHPMITLWVVVTALTLADRFRWLKRKKLAFLSALLAAVVLVLTLGSVVGIFMGKQA